MKRRLAGAAALAGAFVAGMLVATALVAAFVAGMAPARAKTLGARPQKQQVVLQQVISPTGH